MPSQSDVMIRGLRYRIYEWGPPDAPVVLLLHGWADCALSFQFLADALDDAWRLVAPDWRGFGDSAWSGADYWFPDYLADLEALIDHCSPERQVMLLGHSMGGNVAALYAGVRPERVSRLVNLEGFGLNPPAPEQAHARYRRWLDEQRDAPGYRSYPSFEALAAQLLARDKWLRADRAAFVARAWAREVDGKVRLKADPRHKRVSPVLYRREEARDCWSRTRAPCVFGLGADTSARRVFDIDAVLGEFAECYADFRKVVIEQAGHMLHHDQPERVAALIAGAP
jgi:pimeloyl-ACP methyl ester carboxylesterase